jgi:hypothetical protein
MSERTDLSIDIKNRYFFDKMKLDQRILAKQFSKQESMPALQRYIDAGKYVLGPRMEGECQSMVAIIWDLQGTLVSNRTGIFEVYSQYVKNENLRRNYDVIDHLFRQMMHALTGYGKIKEKASEQLVATKLEKSDHVSASKETAEKIELTPYAQEATTKARDMGAMKQLIDTSDFFDVATRIGDYYCGIVGADVKATEALWDGENKFRFLKSNIRDHKLENKLIALRNEGINPNFSMYVCDARVELGLDGKYRIEATDPEIPNLSNKSTDLRIPILKNNDIGLPIMSMAGFETALLGFGVVLKNEAKEVLDKVKKSAEQVRKYIDLPTESNDWVLLDEQFPNTCCVFGTKVNRDLRLVLQPISVWEISMMSSLLFSPRTHYQATKKLQEAKSILFASPTLKRKEALLYASYARDINNELRMSLPVLESNIDQTTDELFELLNQEKFPEQRFLDSARILDAQYRKLIEYWYDKYPKDLNLLRDSAIRYSNRFKEKL